MRARYVEPALLQEPTDEGVRCLTCERRCLIPPGQRGWCRTRQNLGGNLHTLTYGLVASLSCNPIEKKPLYHVHPGSVALTAGSLSCNFDCPWCQNWRISKAVPPKLERRAPRSSSGGDSWERRWGRDWQISGALPVGGDYVSPRAFVQQARERGCQGTSISFNEPALSLEWSLDVFRLARQAGLYNTFVTNGYMTERALDLLIEAGLQYVYLGNVGDHPGGQTVCPGCGATLIRRPMMRATRCRVTPEGRCPRCGEAIAGVGWGRMNSGPDSGGV
jgi:pyruvate formate lyase activating enzyme